MTFPRTILILALCILLLSLAAPAALAQKIGSIEGQVLHAEDGPMAGIPVRLEHFDGMTLVDSSTTETDGEGQFAFTDLLLGEDQIYIARVVYDDVEYSSGMLVVTDIDPAQTVTLNIAGTTEDDSFIVLERVHLIVQPLADAVQIGEMLILSNYGDAGYVGSSLPDGTVATIRVQLPPDAEQVSFESGELGERFVEIEGGIADTRSVPPGRSVDQIVFSYILPAQTDSWTLEYEFEYPVNALNVLVARAGWELVSDDLVFESAMGSDASNFLNYTGGDIAAGETLILQFRPGDVDVSTARSVEMPAEMPAPIKSVQGVLLWIALGLALALLVALASYPIWRKETSSETVGE